MSAVLDADRTAFLALFTNILVRLEVRRRHDSQQVRSALAPPLDALGGGAARADRIGKGVALLRAVWAAVDHIAVPKVRWWGVGHRCGERQVQGEWKGQAISATGMKKESRLMNTAQVATVRAHVAAVPRLLLGSKTLKPGLAIFVGEELGPIRRLELAREVADGGLDLIHLGFAIDL